MTRVRNKYKRIVGLKKRDIILLQMGGTLQTDTSSPSLESQDCNVTAETAADCCRIRGKRRREEKFKIGVRKQSEPKENKLKRKVSAETGCTSKSVNAEDGHLKKRRNRWAKRRKLSDKGNTVSDSKPKEFVEETNEESNNQSQESSTLRSTRKQKEKNKKKKDKYRSEKRRPLSGSEDGNADDHAALKQPKPSAFTLQLEDKLKGAKFRYINEQLYSISGSEARAIFADDSDLFDAYHHGYNEQVKKWPVNPLDLIVADIRHRPLDWIIADMGCGDATLDKLVKHKVHSFDLVSNNDRVTACDMANVPLEDDSVDMCVFCLSLMGTNLADYILEAHRILRMGGILKIAEIMSRFASIQNFRRSIQKMGFDFLKKKSPNDFFVLLDFEKCGEIRKQKPAGLFLKPCLYKKR